MSPVRTRRTSSGASSGNPDSPIYYARHYEDTGDDHTDLQALVDTVTANTYGGRVILDDRPYEMSEPLEMKRMVSIEGSHHPHWFGDTGSGTKFIPTAVPSDTTALCYIREAAIIGGTGNHGGGVKGIHFDGSDVADYGLRMVGACIDWTYDDCEFSNSLLAGSSVVSNGASKPQELNANRCYARSNATTGFDWRAAPDTRVKRCLAMSNGGNGWYLEAMSFSDFAECGAEWNLDRGLVIGGNLPADGLSFTDFKTDSNYNTGVQINGCSDSRPITFNGLYCRRDGRNLGATYGLEIGNDFPNFSAPVVINGLVVSVKPDDAGGTLYRPLIGVRIGAAADLVLIASGAYIWGVNTAISSGAAASVLRLGRPTALVTGNPGAQTRTFVTDSTSAYTVDGGAGTYLQQDEIADPTAPAANTARIYTRDNGAGKTQYVARFPSGAVQVIATEP